MLLTLVESILEDPDIILRKQLDQVKDQKMAEMKMEGIEYDQRMEELEKCEHPEAEPRVRVFHVQRLSPTRHPWVGEENIRPKSIVREMFEEFRSFADYIKLYELQRAEGVLLRHLNSVFKVLAQTVPDAAKNDQLREMELYLGTMIRQVDSSLLDEWEKMRVAQASCLCIPQRILLQRHTGKIRPVPRRRRRHHARRENFHRRDS